MEKEKKVDFDLSKLRLDELIKVYNNIDEFLIFLEGKKIDVEQKEIKSNG